MIKKKSNLKEFKLINLKKNYLNKIGNIKNNNKYIKPTIISVIGHVDHGKTSILEYICKNKIFKKKEITQNINIYNLNKKNKKLLFLDTPGHEDMKNLKNNIINISDIIILVISVEKNISKENLFFLKKLKYLKKNILINFNKIDLNEENIENILKNLIENKIIKNKKSEKIFFNKTSLKKNIGFKKLIKILVKISKINKKFININDKFESIILENNFNKNLGILTTVIIKSGMVKIGSEFYNKNKKNKIRSILDINNKFIINSNKQIIVKLIGFKNILRLGSKIVKNKKILEKKIKKIKIKKKIIIKEKKKKITNNEKIRILYKKNNIKFLNLIIKSETLNILDCIKTMLEKLNTKFLIIKFINISLGNINMSDIKTASITKSNIISFNLKFKNNILKFAEKYKIKLFNFKNIYEIVEYVKELLKEKNIDKKIEKKENLLKVNKIFKISNNKIIAGCLVIKGSIKKESLIYIYRDEKKIFEGKINSLKYLKEDVKEVKENLNCGIFIKNFNNYLIGDIIKT